MVRTRNQETLLNELERRLLDMKGDERKTLLGNLSLVKELDEKDFYEVMSLYAGLLKINGMSEITAFSTTVKICRFVAQRM